MRALVLALFLAACSISKPQDLPPPQLPQRAGVDPIVAARAEGVVFRAEGPELLLHLYRDHRIFLSWDGRQVHFPASEPILPAWRGDIYETRAEGYELHVEIRQGPCRDGDQVYSASVLVRINTEERRGCGREL